MITLGLDIDEEEGFDQVKVAKFKANNKVRVVWELAMAIPMWYSMISTPIFILWPEYHPQYLLPLWLVDFFWLIDLIFNFFKSNSEQDITFSDTACSYLSGCFIFDALATFSAFFSMQAIGFNPWKLCRIVNF